MARTLFVSDVHLRARDPANNQPFLKFLEQDCDALYIVGDLFDYWIGPKHLGMDDYRSEIESIRKKSEKTPIFFIKGNRDYLVEENGGLVQLFGESDSIALDAYFVYPEELKSVARVQVFRDFLDAKAQRWHS